jgi:hypothetical protein
MESEHLLKREGTFVYTKEGIRVLYLSKNSGFDVDEENRG